MEHQLPPMYQNRYMAHALGGYRGFKYLNNEDALRNSIDMGHQYFEVDLTLTADHRLMCSHGWSENNCERCGMEYKPEFAEMTREMFLQQTVHGMPTMDAEKLYSYMKAHPNFYWQMDLHTITGKKAAAVIECLLEEFHHDEELFSHFLVQANSLDMFYGIDQVYHFPYYQMLVKAGSSTEEIRQTVQTCVEHGISAIALPIRDASEAHIRMIREAGLAVLVYSVDNENLAKRLWEAGANTICTNFLSPAAEAMETRSYEIVYNSCRGETTLPEEMLTKHVFRGTMLRTKKGSVEYHTIVTVQKEEPYPLMGNYFIREGFVFKGWTIRFRGRDRTWKWKCTDGSWRNKEDAISETGEDLRLVIEDEAEIRLDMLRAENRIIFEACWSKTEAAQ